MKITERIEFSIPLERLLGCRTQEHDFEQQDYKGIYVSGDGRWFYVFINNYYLTGELDSPLKNFQILDIGSRSRLANQVHFKGKHPLIERRSIKYIKEVGNVSYLTMNPSETYKLEIESTNEKKGEEHFVAKKVDGILAHLCPNQLLEINRIIFCFEPSVSSTGNQSD